MRSNHSFSQGRALLWAVAVPAALLLGFLLSTPRPAQAAEEVRAYHLIVRTREEAEKIRKEIMEKGGTFEAFVEAVRKYSKDAGTKPLGGDVGWFQRRGTMDPAFSDAAFALEVGQISEPVKSQYGWHLIYVRDRRDRNAAGAPASAPASNSDSSGAGTDTRPESGDTGSTSTGGEAGSSTSTEAGGSQSGTASAQVVAPPYQPKPRVRPAKSLIVKIESVQSEQRFGLERQTIFESQTPVEVNLIFKNDGSQDRRIPALSLAPLGFSVTRHHDGAEIKGDFSAIQKPENWFVTLKTGDIAGRVISIPDYFKGLTASGRFELRWTPARFFAELEKRFPEVKTAVADYETVKADLTSRDARIQYDYVRRDAALHWAYKNFNYFNFSIFERPTTTGTYFARIQLQGKAEPIVIELDMANQPQGAQQFMVLALEGFYDLLNFFDVREGDYVLGGCPNRTGTGAPDRLVRARNDKNLPHERGTVSFVSRSIRRQGPARGGEIGSIFFICLKPHPEWNDEHVPFGKVVEGLEVLDTLKTGETPVFQSVDILTEAEYRGSGVAAAEGVEYTTGNPEAIIVTSKGELRVVLYEDSAPNTVANFITLAEQGFYEKGPNGGKQTFFALVKDEQGKLLIQTGSPTNSPEGDPGYKIPDEVNSRKCVKGALVMAKLYDEEAKTYVPDSAGSQFFICLRDIPYFDYLGVFTVFGQVTGGLDVLDKLEEGDTLEAVKIVRKKRRPYDRFRKVGP